VAVTVQAAAIVPGAAVTGLTGVLQLGETTTATAATTEAGAGTWTSSTPAVASVDGSTGAVVALTAGTTTIAYTISTSGNLNSQPITVYAAATVADPTIGAVQVDAGDVTPTGFTAAGTGETIAWASSVPAKATVDATTGVITPVEAGDTTISYAVVDTATGAVVVKGSVAVTVQAAPIVRVPGFTVLNNFHHVIGYDVDLRLVNAKVSDVQTITITLYNGSATGTALGIVTSTGKLKTDYPNLSYLSAPFDVLGTFNYGTDGYWTYNGWQGNTSIIPDTAVVTVTFTNGLVKTGASTKLTGNTSIFNANQDAPTGLTGVAPTTYGGTDGTITGTTTAMEYKLSTGVNYTPATASPTTVGVAGTYNVRYVATPGFNAGTAADVVVAAALDTTAPVITLLGTTPVDVANEAAYTDAGATALDDVDGDITANIVTTISNDVNLETTFDSSVAATYTYHYNVRDAALNPAVEVTRTVVVAAYVAPSVVYVDDDYTSSSAGGHVWQYDAFAVIQEGIDVVASPGTVNVAAGTYTEQLLIQKSLNLVGTAGMATTIVKAPGGRTGTAPAFSLTPSFQADYIAAAYPVGLTGTISVKITGFTFDGDNQPMVNGDRYPGVFFRKVSGATVADAGLFACTVKGFLSSDTETSGIWVEDTCRLTINGNTFSDFTEYGVHVYGDASHTDPVVTTSGNILNAGPTSYGILYWTDAGTISGNTVTGGLSGIQIAEASGNTVSNNTVTGGERGIVLDAASNNSISNNTISGGSNNGITMTNSSNSNSISGNTISNRSYPGFLHTVTDVNAGNAAWAIAFESGSNNTVTGNDITTSDVAIENWDGGTGNTATGNKIYGNFFGVHNHTAIAMDATYNWWGAASGPLHATNPDGAGNPVSDNVAFKPFYSNVEMTTTSMGTTTIDIAAVPGVTAPVKNATPVTTITETAQYTGTVTWSPTHSPFWAATAYTATIILTPKTGYTLTGVAADFFTVTDATSDTNPAGSGVVTAVFPATGAVQIGDSYGGGIVAYILQVGDPGYVAGVTKGLIAATADQSTSIYWHFENAGTTGATATALGTGNANTDAIILLYGGESNAARVCYDYTNVDTGTGVYSDWYLPSKDELNKLYENKGTVGGFAGANYWSSSEDNANYAWYQNFYNGDQFNFNKNYYERVRAVRAF